MAQRLYSFAVLLHPPTKQGIAEGDSVILIPPTKYALYQSEEAAQFAAIRTLMTEYPDDAKLLETAPQRIEVAVRPF